MVCLSIIATSIAETFKYLKTNRVHYCQVFFPELFSHFASSLHILSLTAMNFILMIIFFTLSATKAKPVRISENENICQNGRFGDDFTGIIVQDQKTLDYPPQNHIRLTRCVDGAQRQFDAFLPLKKSLNIPWSRKICTGQKNEKATCYIMARRESTSHRSINIFRPGEWVGGIFLCPGHLMDDGIQCTNQNSTPLWPLVASNFTIFEQQVRATDLVRIPLLISYDVEESNEIESIPWN